MALAARWIRLHPPGITAMRAACAAFAGAQAPDAAPAVLWARIPRIPGIEDDRHAFAVIAPLKHLP